MGLKESVTASPGDSNDTKVQKVPFGTSATADASQDTSAEKVPPATDSKMQEGNKAQAETTSDDDDAGESNEKKEKKTPGSLSQKLKSTSHDSKATTDAQGSSNTPPSPTSQKNGSNQDDEDAHGALNAVLWEAGLSKKEVSKRTKLQGGEVVELDLERCEQLTTLPPQIGKLSKLKTLNLSGCKELVTLPAEIAKLQSLTELYLTNCNKLEELPPELGELSSLSELYLTNCWSLKSLPSEIGNLSSLHQLYLTGCKELKELPESIGDLSGLTELKLFSCLLLKTLPSTIGQLSKLTKLDLRLCDGIEKLPLEIGKLSRLTALNLTGCTNLSELPLEIGNLKKLTELNLKDCKELKALPTTITQLSQLTELNCDGCTKLKKLAPELKQFESQLGSQGKRAAKGNKASRATGDKSQSGLDIMRMAAAHLEKVPEAPGGSTSSTPSKSGRDASMFRSPETALALADEYFENVPSPPPANEVIDALNPNDVLCGRGGESNHNSGNVKYRALVKQHQVLYLEAKRLDKPKIALKIVNLVRKSGGRFLKKDSVLGTWRDVGNQKAREKTSQTLREGAPELREPLPNPPLASQGFPNNGPGMMDPVLELQKRQAEELSGQIQPARKKFKLPMHAPAGGPPMFGPGDQAMMPPSGTQNMQTDHEINDPYLRAARNQMLKARQSGSEPPVTPASKPGEPSIGAPSALDVVYGKGKAIQDHVGNVRFRSVVDMHRQAYHSAFRRADKTQISKDIVQWIRSIGGRFLQLDFASGKYHDVGDECARDKVSHALRSRKEVQARQLREPSPNQFIPREERERVMAYTMGIVRNLQHQQDQGGVERAYYQQHMNSTRGGGGGHMLSIQGNNHGGPAMMMTPPSAAGGQNSMGASPSMSAASRATPEGAPKNAAQQKLQDGTPAVKNWPLRDVGEPHDNDVLYGRGGKSNHHPGNKRYRQAVKNREWDYLRRKNKDKQVVAMEVVREWRNQNPPGRFLKKDEKTGLWNDVGDQKAREKTSQAFRENAPHQPPPMFRAAGSPGMPGMPPSNMNMVGQAASDMEKMMLWRNMSGQFPPPSAGQNGTQSNEGIASPGSNQEQAEV